MELLTDVVGQKVPLPKICHTYPPMMKLCTVIPYLKSIKKINHVTHPMSSANISNFSTKITNFCYINKYRYRFYFNIWLPILLSFLKSLKVFSINMVAILKITPKLVNLCLLEINKYHENLFFVYDVTNKILSRESNYILDSTPVWAKTFELNVRKFWGLILIFVEFTGKILVRESFYFPHPK